MASKDKKTLLFSNNKVFLYSFNLLSIYYPEINTLLYNLYVGVRLSMLFW